MFRKPCPAGFKKILGESVETIICRLEGDVTDPVASEYLMTWYTVETTGY
jgi:hypothetical protein